jgi:hypothetical protein
VSVRFIGTGTGGGGGGGAPVFANIVTATAASSQDNYAPAGFSNTTSFLVITPASGGSTINGLSSTGFINGQSLQIRNGSTTDDLDFPNLAGTSLAANQFANLDNGTVSIGKNGSAILTYYNSQWTFSS